MSGQSSPDAASTERADRTNTNKRRALPPPDGASDKRQKFCWLQGTTKIPREEKSPLLLNKSDSSIETSTSSIDLCPAASAWLLESDWQDQAYKELLFLRNMHSRLLEQVYEDGRAACYERCTKSVKGQKKHLEKLVNFLGKSRDEMGALTKEECHDLMIDIRRVVAYHAKQDSNWRDEAYERLRSLRKLYSCKLDDAYKYVHGGDTKSKLLTRYQKECSRFLQFSLNLLGSSRADLTLITEGVCNKYLEGIKSFAEDGNDSVMWRRYNALRRADSFSSCENQQQEESSWPNWRDMAYEELQSMKEVVLLDDYRSAHSVWSEYPHLKEDADKLGEYILCATHLILKARSDISLLSKDEHAWSMKQITLLVEKIENIKIRLLKDEPITI